MQNYVYLKLFKKEKNVFRNSSHVPGIKNEI